MPVLTHVLHTHMTEFAASHRISLRIHVRFNASMPTDACIKIESFKKDDHPKIIETKRD